MRILLSFDKFKDAMTARAAVEAAAGALEKIHPEWQLDRCALTDGGEGFTQILTEAAGGLLRSHRVNGPRGDPVDAVFGLVPVKNIPGPVRTRLQMPPSLAGNAVVAVIEMAAASGLGLLAVDERDPWHTSTQGTGQLMGAAVAAGAVAILLGVGGSATNDLGLGTLDSLGLRFHSATDAVIRPPVPAKWREIVRISGELPDKFPPVYIACDVTNPLLGPRGAAAVYGPQKGLRAKDHGRLEQESDRIAQLLCAHCGCSPARRDVPGAGAAGGIAFGLMAATGARLLPGFELVAAWLGMETRLDAAEMVLTGEGCFDASSLEGKGPGAIAAHALARGKPVHVFAGQVTASARPGLSLHPITPAGTPLSQALRDAPANLAACVRQVFSQTNFSSL